MNRGSFLVLLIFIGLFICSFTAFSQSSEDSVKSATPFRKGRWLTGLSGSITSGSNSLDTIGSGVTRNEYTIDFRTGKFVRDRLMLGGLLALSRSNTKEFTKRTLETLFIGPLVSWYLTDGEQGSLFVTGGGGFTKFRDESGSLQSTVPTQVLVDGNGVGMIVRFGYSYVLHDRVAFDLGLNYTSSWLYADVTEQPANTRTKENFVVANFSFTFGISVLLESFLF